MKILKYKAEQFNTDDAHQLCLDLEAELGVNLMVHDKDNPNDVQGYVNTSNDGTIEIYLYEDTDVNEIKALPEYTEEIVEVQ